MQLTLVAALLALVALSACSAEPAGTEPENPRLAENPRLEGVVVAIDSAAIDDIKSFTLKDGDETYEIYIADDVEYGFPLGHLQEHVQGAEPVAVDTEERDGKLYAITIEDV